MPILVTCDHPGCEATAPAVYRRGTIDVPSGWWKPIPSDENKLLVWCCAEHMNKTLGGGVPNISK